MLMFPLLWLSICDGHKNCDINKDDSKVYGEIMPFSDVHKNKLKQLWHIMIPSCVLLLPAFITSTLLEILLKERNMYHSCWVMTETHNAWNIDHIFIFYEPSVSKQIVWGNILGPTAAHISIKCAGNIRLTSHFIHRLQGYSFISSSS